LGGLRSPVGGLTVPAPGSVARGGADEEPGSRARVPPRGLACSLCARLLGSPEQLREHEDRHSLSLMALSLDWPRPHPQALRRRGEPLERHLCSHCPASFTLKSNADRHEKTIHHKRKLLQCARCLKHFRDRTDLRRHLSSVHSRERGYACAACAKAFSTQKNLATHVKVCCQLGPVPGGGGGGGAGMEMEMSQCAVIDSLWRLSREMRVGDRDLGINVED